jgi:hypothetical protein
MLLLTLLSTIASGEAYNWLDANGDVHYGDRPPASGADARSMAPPPAPSMDDDHEQRTLLQQRLLEAIDAERAEHERSKAEASAARRERAQQCEQAELNLARFERANIIYMNDESGGRVYMSDDARREAAANARLWLARHCQ